MTAEERAAQIVLVSDGQLGFQTHPVRNGSYQDNPSMLDSGSEWTATRCMCIHGSFGKDLRAEIAWHIREAVEHALRTCETYEGE